MKHSIKKALLANGFKAYNRGQLGFGGMHAEFGTCSIQVSKSSHATVYSGISIADVLGVIPVSTVETANSLKSYAIGLLNQHAKHYRQRARLLSRIAKSVL